MVFTKALSYEEIVSQLDKNDVITIISCTSCARTSGTGGEGPMRKLALRLQEDGYKVVGGYTLYTVCTPKVMQARLDLGVNTIISMACSSGTSNLEKLFDSYKVIETTMDIGLMSADNKEKKIKVAMPYQASMDTKGKKFEMYTGEAVVEGA